MSAERHGVPAPAGYDAIMTGTAGLYELRHDGSTCGSVFLPPDLNDRGPTMLRVMVDALNAGDLGAEGWPGWTGTPRPGVRCRCGAVMLGTTDERARTSHTAPDGRLHTADICGGPLISPTTQKAPHT
jgi:hypothetical protein